MSLDIPIEITMFQMGMQPINVIHMIQDFNQLNYSEQIAEKYY